MNSGDRDSKRRWYVPGAPDLVFAGVLALTLGGGRSLLGDPGTFWHLRLGREVLRTGRVPRVDTMTFTRAGEPWVDQSWAFDVAQAWVFDRFGWAGLVGATALGLAWIYGCLARALIDDGTSPIAAVMTAAVAVGLGAVHFLSRPHILTFAFVFWTFRACRLYHEGRSRRLLLLPLVMVAWANIHGGFLAGPVIAATAAFGEAISGWWDRARRRRIGVFLGLTLLSCLAPLANPYGFGLYRHVYKLLIHSGVTALIQEYHPVTFGAGKVQIVEFVLFALIVLPMASRLRPGPYEWTHLFVWLHFALGSIRQAPLFAFALAPVLARLIDGVLTPSERSRPPRTWPRPWSWSVALTAAVIAAVAGGLGDRIEWRDPNKWPLAALPKLDAQPVGARMFHEQDWGGFIEMMCDPQRPTYIDDRFELFGKGFVEQYLLVFHGGPAWDYRRDEYDIALVWVRPDSGLTQRLDAEPAAWEVLHRDRVSVLYRRKGGVGKAASGR